MSFSFAPSRFGQIPGEDGGFSDPFATTGTIPGTTAAAQGGGSLSRGGRTYTGTLAQSKPKADRAADIKAKRQQISKAADNRAKMGIKTFVADVVASVAFVPGAAAAKKALNDVLKARDAKLAEKGQYAKAERERVMRSFESDIVSAVSNYTTEIVAAAQSLVRSCFDVTKPYYLDKYPAPFGLLFVLRKDIYDTLAKAKPSEVSAASWNRLADTYSAGVKQAKAFIAAVPSGTKTNLAALPYAAFERLLVASVTGASFPDLGWDAGQVQSNLYATYSAFLNRTDTKLTESAREQIFQRIAGNAAADRMGVSDLEVQRLRKELQILESTAGVDTSSLYEGGKSTSGSYTAEQRKSAEKARREAENKRREAVRARDVAAKAEAARRAAQARADTAEATRLEQEKRAAEERARAAEAQAADAERRAAEATASAVTGGTTAPSATGETAMVVTDSTGTPAVVVADEAVVPVVPTAPAKMNVGLLVVAAAAIGGGIWWFKNRRA